MKFLILIVALIAYVSAASVGSSDDNLPKEVDWRKQGAVTRVKSQGKHCNADFAFVTAGLLEAYHFIKTGKLVELSVQNLIDCYDDDEDVCYFGSILSYALEYVIDHGGLDTEESYPYKGYVRTCSFNASNVGATAKSYVQVEYGDENKLKEVVANIGPTSVFVSITDEVKHYTSGIISKCRFSTEVKNGDAQYMLLVGYGTDNETQQDYWILKNSWGTNWGENGYMRVLGNTNDHCGLTANAYYVVV